MSHYTIHFSEHNRRVKDLVESVLAEGMSQKDIDAARIRTAYEVADKQTNPFPGSDFHPDRLAEKCRTSGKHPYDILGDWVDEKIFEARDNGTQFYFNSPAMDNALHQIAFSLGKDQKFTSVEATQEESEKSKARYYKARDATADKPKRGREREQRAKLKEALLACKPYDLFQLATNSLSRWILEQTPESMRAWRNQNAQEDAARAAAARGERQPSALRPWPTLEINLDDVASSMPKTPKIRGFQEPLTPVKIRPLEEIFVKSGEMSINEAVIALASPKTRREAIGTLLNAGKAGGRALHANYRRWMVVDALLSLPGSDPSKSIKHLPGSFQADVIALEKNPSPSALEAVKELPSTEAAPLGDGEITGSVVSGFRALRGCRTGIRTLDAAIESLQKKGEAIKIVKPQPNLELNPDIPF